MKMLTGLPLGGLIIGSGLTNNQNTYREGLSAVESVNKHQRNSKSIYEPLGVTPLINARGTVTIIGATRVLPEVQQAMEAATREYVQLDELMDGVGNRLGELTGAEWGMVSTGASGAITAGTSGVITGGDPDRIWQIPDLSGLKDEVIIPAYSRSSYDAAVRSVGAKIIEVSNIEELESAIGPKTAMIYLLTGSRSEEGPLSIREISRLAKPLGIPILADAAAEGLYFPNPHLEQGADLVAYSGGKYLRGPQCAGLLIGRKDLVQAAWFASAPHHGSGRGYKVGREEIMGMLAAVEVWFERDYEKEMLQWTSWLEEIAGRLDQIEGVSTEIRQPNRRSNRSPSLNVHWDSDRISLTGQDVERLLWDGNPRISVGGAGSFLPFPPNSGSSIYINSSQLEEGEQTIVADRAFEVLSDPPKAIRAEDAGNLTGSSGMAFAFWPPFKRERTGAASFDLTGQWDLEMNFAASTVKQTLVFEQQENELIGTHTASMAPRDLSGTLHGNDIQFRSSYTGQGMRINYTFTGAVNGDAMEGRVSLGEYGMADWKARRREYQIQGR